MRTHARVEACTQMLARTHARVFLLTYAEPRSADKLDPNGFIVVDDTLQVRVYACVCVCVCVMYIDGSVCIHVFMYV